MSAEPPEYDALRSVAARIEQHSVPITGASVRTRATTIPARRWTGRVLAAVAVVVAIALVVGVSVVALRRDDPSVVRTGSTSLHTGTGTDHIDLAAGDCIGIATSPLNARSGHSAVWTGDEMIVWGGDDGRTSFSDGAAYDPDTRTWRELAPAPIDARFDHVAVWTGKEMLLWGGHDHQRAFTDGAAYNPDTNRWRRIASSPVNSPFYPAYVWTGTELISAGANERSGGVSAADPVAYNPSIDSWRRLPAPPTTASQPAPPAWLTSGTWTGHDAVFALGGSGSDSGVVAFDPKTNKWTRLAGTDTFPISQISGVFWDGNRILTLSTPSGYEIDPVAHSNSVSGRTIPTPPDPDLHFWSGISTWASDQALLWNSGLAMAYFPDAGAWTRSAGVSVPATYIDDETGVWTGHTYLVWGGVIGPGRDNAARLADGVAYRPGTDRATSSTCALRQEQARAAVASATATAPLPIPSSWTTRENTQAGLSLSTPPDWKQFHPAASGMPADKLVVATDSGLTLRSNRACPDPDPKPGSVYVSIGEYTGTGPFQFHSGMGIDGRITARPPIFRATSASPFPACSPRLTKKQLREKAINVDAYAPKTYEWVFRENGRILNATVMLSVNPTEADLNLAFDILNSLRVNPPPAGTQPPVIKPGQSPFCAGIEDLRTAGLYDQKGSLKPEALPALERLRGVAPADAQPPIDTILDWLREGAPKPKPAAVSDAELRSTRDWIRLCQ